MAVKISQLNEPTEITGDEVFPLAHAGANFKFKLGNIKNLVNKSDLGLGSVDNTADLYKPISNPVQSAINIINYRIDNLAPAITLGAIDW